MSQHPSPGRVVLYVLPEHYPHHGEVRPAIVTRAWSRLDNPLAPGMSNLHVLLDGSNDLAISETGTLWVGSVVHDPDGKPGTWHWPPRV